MILADWISNVRETVETSYSTWLTGCDFGYEKAIRKLSAAFAHKLTGNGIV